MRGAVALAGLAAIGATLAVQEGASPGERLYRTGVAASGKPAPALLRGDVRADSAALTCAACHLGSGFGAVEGGQTAPPLRWHRLSEVGANSHGRRRGYDEKTLLRAITRGLDSQGRPLSPVMPRYELGPQDRRNLAAFLRSRGRADPAGVAGRTLTFAAVIAPDADPRQRRAMESVLAQFASHVNPRQRGGHGSSPPRADGTPVSELRYEDWTLALWELEGPPTGWRAQLERRQVATPVFALVSGLAGATWGPVQQFCEERRIPCVLPNVDAPPAEPGWWTMYYSAGVGLEAEVMARSIPQAARVAQVFRTGTVAAAGAARLAGLRGVVGLDPSGRVPDGMDTIVLWLGADEAAAWATRAGKRSVWISATAAGPTPPAIAGARVVQPFALPEELKARRLRFDAWARARKIEVSDLRIQEQTLFAVQLVGHALFHMHDDLDQEYLMEVAEHANSMAPFSASYGRLSFGPGQRFLSKGAWVIPGAGGGAEWVVP